MSEPLRTRLHPRYWIKTVIFMIALFGLGGWGLYDAVWYYPAKGARHADWCKWQYLQAAQSAGLLASTLSIPDPAAERARLLVPGTRAAITAAAGSATDPRRGSARVELARLEWLESLHLIGRATPDHTVITDAFQELTDLDAAWAGRPNPQMLEKWDIPAQWAFVVIGGIGGPWMLLRFLRVVTKVYRWDPADLRLHLPGGSSLVPADLADIDKRKWHKFLVTLDVGPGHDRLAGRKVQVDLYHYDSLEGWVLEMERAAFPDRDPAPAAAEPVTEIPNTDGEPPAGPGPEPDRPE